MKEIFTSETRCTRKEFTCSGCRRTFPKGSYKYRTRVVGDDKPYSFQKCLTCKYITNKLFDLDREFRIDGVSREDILEYVTVYLNNDWAYADSVAMLDDLEVPT